MWRHPLSSAPTQTLLEGSRARQPPHNPSRREGNGHGWQIRAPSLQWEAGSVTWSPSAVWGGLGCGQEEGRQLASGGRGAGTASHLLAAAAPLPTECQPAVGPDGRVPPPHCPGPLGGPRTPSFCLSQALPYHILVLVTHIPVPDYPGPVFGLLPLGSSVNRASPRAGPSSQLAPVPGSESVP